MKKNLLTVALAASLAFGAKAQSIYFSGFETWGTSASTFTNSPTSPTDWMGSKTTASVTLLKVTASVEQGSAALNIVNTTTTAVRLTTQPSFTITQGMAYLVSYYAKGKGSIRVGLYTGKSTSAGFGYATYSPYETVNNGWKKFSQSVIADTTNGTTAQFILSVKSTGTYTGTPNVIGLDIDSVNIVPYTIPTVSLHDMQYTTDPLGYSPYYGKYVTTGGMVSATYSAGCYVQTTNDTTWGGALVYSYNKPSWMNPGDSVNFTAYVDEYYAGGSTMTELDVDTTGINHVSSGHPLPTPVQLTTSAMNDESLEGILVTTQYTTTCITYTATYQQGTINDGSGAVNVDRQLFPYAYTVGDVYKVTGIIDYGYGYNIEPRFAADIQDITMGIQQYNNDLHANIYPNPVANNLSIALAEEAHNATVSIIDVLGKEVMAVNSLSGTELNINNINLPAGVYVVKVVADGKTQITKIIKQ